MTLAEEALETYSQAYDVFELALEAKRNGDKVALRKAAAVHEALRLRFHAIVEAMNDAA